MDLYTTLCKSNHYWYPFFMLFLHFYFQFWLPSFKFLLKKKGVGPFPQQLSQTSDKSPMTWGSTCRHKLFQSPVAAQQGYSFDETQMNCTVFQSTLPLKLQSITYSDRTEMTGVMKSADNPKASFQPITENSFPIKPLTSKYYNGQI